ncbi:Uma2 family endonuclease [Micromonospora cathayae]|uniref:Uma2 family endonuclease n=1 Tax=Micromonospora cathayae TaxID=3028804 RepID=A0ABY7ZWZ0_9ACTN|nr:Uma2 family endonuclease [Micromonospora sp. HUAS 3]WDZ87435.1 Uma2 family endonuclease [Micromonospora sp. HUAS 3]
MTAAPILPERSEWTVDDLDDLPKDLPYELVNGRLIVPSPTPLHQFICARVMFALEQHCPDDYFVSIDQSLSVDRRNEPRPDVVAVRVEHANRSPVPVEAAVLAVEVASPDSTFRDRYDKARLYAAAGVPSYRVIDPLREKVTLTELLLSPKGGYEPSVETDGLITIDRPWKTTMDLPAWTARRRSVLERAGT